MIGHPPEMLFEEVAYLAFHFHWPYSEIGRLPHLERRRWVEEAAALNRRLEDAHGEAY
jgi:hypothetical protein